MSDQDTPPVDHSPEPQTPKASPEKISEYVVSWRWLLIGLILLSVLGAAGGGIYYYRWVNLSKDVLNVAGRMKTDAEKAREAGDQELFRATMLDASNLLMDYNRKQPGNVNVLLLLNDLLEALLKEEQGDAMLRQLRQTQIVANCKDLIQVLSSNKESLEYHERIMQLEWELGHSSEAIDRAKQVLQIDKLVNNRENYDALRYMTLATLRQLPTLGYQPSQLQASFPTYMDELLDKILRMRPDNIEIAYRTAEFIIDVENREEFRKCASPKLREMSEEDRTRQAMTIIDDMVSRNSKNVQAFLVRYDFKRRFLPAFEETQKFDPDLQAVLNLEPDNPEGLIRAGLYTQYQSILARHEGDTALAGEKKKVAEGYFKHVVAKNPKVGLGYQHLGDFYAADARLADAIKVWNDGVEQNLPFVNPELVARLVDGLTTQKKFEEASEKVALLNRFVSETRTMPTDVARQIRNLAGLLTARLYDAEGTEAVAKAEAAQAAGRTEEANRLFTLSQRKKSDAVQILEKLLGSFGKTSHDYVVDGSSIYARLIGESLMLAGRLMAEQSKWYRAVFFYQAAMPFPQFRQRASVAAAGAYQQQNRPDEAIRLLADAVDRDPENMTVRYIYTQSLFRHQMARNDTTISDFEAVEKQLAYLAENRDRLPSPWTVDLQMVQLEMAKESLSNDPQRILKAQQTAIRKFRELEKKELPQKAKEGEQTESGEKKTYSDDLAFLSELAGIYSSLAQLSDFDNVLDKMRELPDGEAAYFSEKINDALRRNDRDGAMAVVEEATESDQLTQAQKQRFIALMQNLKEDDTNSLDRIFARLKSTYDRNPDALKPQAFFLLANMALDRDDFQYAEVLQERLEKIEGAPELGTMWRYIKARRLLMQKEPPFDAIRQLQEEIAQRADSWDLTHLLKASIEERALLGKEADSEAKKPIADAYREAIRCGNVQPQVWNRLLMLLEEANLTEDAQKLQRDALVRGIRLESGPGQFPQPYQRMYTQVHESLEDDPANADVVARQCIVLAEGRRENPELIFRLNMELGKLFLDAGMTDSAQRHLRAVAKRGGTFVYPLAVSLAKARQVDEGFGVLLDEIDRMPSSMGTLIPSLLVLLSQVKPSEEVFQRIDKLMVRIENGERPVLKGTIEAADSDDFIPLNDRRIRSLYIRFPDNKQTPPTDSIILLPPDHEPTVGAGEEKPTPAAEMPKTTEESESSEEE